MRCAGYVFTKDDGLLIERVLTRLSECVDAIVVFDDGSVDDTCDIVSRFPKVVRLFRGQPDRLSQRAANFEVLWGELQKLEPDWVMGIDSDDVVDARFPALREALLSDTAVGRYYFNEITLWDGTDHYRIDKPEWYMRRRSATPLLFRWSKNVRASVAQYGSRRERLAAAARRSWPAAAARWYLRPETLEHSRLRWVRECARALWQKDYLNYTKVNLLGVDGEEVELPLVRLHYHYYDLSRAWRRHMTYALNTALIGRRSPSEVSELVRWATRRMDTRGLELAPVKPEWGAL